MPDEITKSKDLYPLWVYALILVVLVGIIFMYFWSMEIDKEQENKNVGYYLKN